MYVALYLIICIMVVKQKKDANSICDVVLSVSGLKPPLMMRKQRGKTMKQKRSILSRIIDIIITPAIWVGERKPVTQIVIIVGLLFTIIIVTGILHDRFRTESDCKARLDICVKQYNTCMKHAK